MLNFGFKKKSDDDKSSQVNNDQDITATNSQIEEDIFALAAKEEEEKNADNLIAPPMSPVEVAPEIPTKKTEEVVNQAIEQLPQNSELADLVIAKDPVLQVIIAEVAENVSDDQKVVETSKVENIQPEINIDIKADQSTAAIAALNTENLASNQEGQIIIKDNQEANTKITASNNQNKFTNPNNQNPEIWVPQLIEILKEMAKEEASAE